MHGLPHVLHKHHSWHVGFRLVLGPLLLRLMLRIAVVDVANYRSANGLLSKSSVVHPSNEILDSLNQNRYNPAPEIWKKLKLSITVLQDCIFLLDYFYGWRHRSSCLLRLGNDERRSYQFNCSQNQWLRAHTRNINNLLAFLIVVLFTTLYCQRDCTIWRLPKTLEGWHD